MLMGWVKIINSFYVKLISVHGSVYPEFVNIGKLNDLCIINLTYYNLYGNIMRGKYYISIALHFPYFH